MTEGRLEALRRLADTGVMFDAAIVKELLDHADQLQREIDRLGQMVLRGGANGRRGA